MKSHANHMQLCLACITHVVAAKTKYH